MDRRPMLAIVIVALVISIFSYIYAYFSSQAQGLLIAASVMLAGALFATTFLRSGSAASVFWLHFDQIYRLISVSKTSSGEYVYLLENAGNKVFCIKSKEAFDGTLPCHVSVIEKENNYIIKACNSPLVTKG